MQVNSYLFYKGNCAEAFDFYAGLLGGVIEAKMTYAQAPEGMPMPAGYGDKIMHAALNFEGEVLMGSDAPPDHYNAPQGFSVSLQFTDAAEGEKKFKALAEGGTIRMPFAATFWSKGFGMCVDRFGIPWMINCP
jgi:PhnB protein